MSKTQQLLAAATPAPWHYANDGPYNYINSDTLGVASLETAADAALIIHLRNTADAAQAVIEAARAFAGELATPLDKADWERYYAINAALAAYDEADK